MSHNKHNKIDMKKISLKDKKEYIEECNYSVWYVSLKVSSIKKLYLFKNIYSFKKIYNLSDLDLVEKGKFNLLEINTFKKSKLYFSDSIYDQCSKDNIFMMPLNSIYYPIELERIVDPPFLLYVKGNLSLLDRLTCYPSISIVGARICSQYGTNMAKNISKAISLKNYNIISGMANGIDSASHIGALSSNGFTAAILGCGVNVCYPAKNKKLYDEIIKKGLLISEYPPDSPPIKFYFPLRNRIIAGLSKATIVIEAKIKSGSLITAHLAEDYNRVVYALPGRITDILSQGTNKLIQDGAIMIESIEFLLSSLGLSDEKGNKSFSDIDMDIILTNDELKVFNEVDYYALHIDNILSKSNLSENIFYKSIQSLINKHKIKEIFPDYFIKI